MKTQDARSLPAKAQEAIRRKAVNAVLDGMRKKEAAKIFGVTRQTIGKWIRAYKKGGEKELKAKRQGRPKGGTLLPWQAAQIANSVIDRQPEQLKLPFYLWTRKAVAELIERKYGIRLSIWTVGRYLNHWGFTPQKPIRRAFEQNPEHVQRWLQEHYPAICQHAKKEKARIYWGDEMGVRSDHAAGRCYGRRGKTPVISRTGQRFGCNMISAITNQGQLTFMVFKKRFRVDVFLEFLRRLIRHSHGRVFLIVDKHPVHRSTGVKKWLTKNAAKIRLFFLPGYCPELNPDELLNQDVKSNAVGRRCAGDQQELTTNVRSYLYSRQRRPHIVKKYFHAETVRYAAI
jgi:transposase